METSEYLAQRRKGANGRQLSFRPFRQTQDKLREKSFFDPSLSLGMTGLGPSLSVFAPLRDKI
jgi:hypothetical protein